MIPFIFNPMEITDESMLILDHEMDAVMEMEKHLILAYLAASKLHDEYTKEQFLELLDEPIGLAQAAMGASCTPWNTLGEDIPTDRQSKLQALGVNNIN